jgi:membrane associated rhomboid family serine protease
MTDARDPKDDNNVTPFRPRPKPSADSPAPVYPVANDSGGASEPMLNLPPAVKGFCLLLIVIHLAQFVMPADMVQAMLYNFGFVPARYTGGMDFSASAAAAVVTHMFLHGGFLHLLMNIGMLMAFGTALEGAIGGRKLFLIFAVTGLLGALFHLAVYHDSVDPLIGASGGISGLFGAVMMAMHRQGLMGGTRLWPFAAIWIVVSLLFGFLGMPGEAGAIAWTVHIAGFIAGMALFKPVLRLRI